MHLKNNYFILILFILFNIGQNFSQEKNIAVYYEGKGYLQPFIESTIDSLKDINTDDYLFKTSSINRLILQNQVEAERVKLLQIYVNTEKVDKYLSESEKSTIREINRQINQNGYLLTVKTNVLVELIEFQFQLFEPKEQDYSASYVRLISSEDLFINPKDPNYKTDLKNAIHRLFKKSNNRPESKLFYFEKKINTNDSILIPINTIIKLDGSQSGDKDNEKLKYIWRNVYSKNSDIQTSKKILLNNNDNDSIQNIKILNDGDYKLGFKVFDGITNSKEIFINIKTINRPKKVKISDSIFFSEHNRTILRINEVEINNKTAKLILDDNKIDEKDILLTTEKIDKYFDYSKHQEIVYNNFEIDSLTKITGETIKLLKINSAFGINSNLKEYFLYRKHSNNFISPPIKLKHHLKKFFMASLSTDVSMNYIFKYNNFENSNENSEIIDDQNRFVDSTKINEVVFSQKISFNLHMTRDISMSLSVPFTTRTIKYKDHTFESPAIFSTAIKFSNNNNHNYSNKKKIHFNHLKLSYNFFGTKARNPYTGKEDDSNAYYFIYQSLGASFGFKSKLLRTKLMHIDLTYDLGGSFFLKELKDLAEIESLIGLHFRFNSY